LHLLQGLPAAPGSAPVFLSGFSQYSAREIRIESPALGLASGRAEW